MSRILLNSHSVEKCNIQELHDAYTLLMRVGANDGVIDKQTLCATMPGLPSLFVENLDFLFGNNINVRQLICALIPCWGGNTKDKLDC